MAKKKAKKRETALEIKKNLLLGEDFKSEIESSDLRDLIILAKDFLVLTDDLFIEIYKSKTYDDARRKIMDEYNKKYD